eukprot:g696.t1
MSNRGTNSQGNSYTTPGGTNGNQGGSYSYQNTNASLRYGKFAAHRAHLEAEAVEEDDDDNLAAELRKYDIEDPGMKLGYGELALRKHMGWVFSSKAAGVMAAGGKVVLFNS